MLIQGGGDARAPAADDTPAPPPPVTPDGPAIRPSRAGWVLAAITTAGGLLCAFGLTIMVAWPVHATAVLLVGSQNPVTFNTALALALTGGALVARRPGVTWAAGGFDVVLGALVLAEYALGRDLGIDQLVVRAYISGPDGHPGRIAANTAICLVLAGAGLLVGGPRPLSRRPAALAAAGSAIAAIAVTAAFGYATGTPAAYGWGHLSAMPLPTTTTLLILAFSLLSAAWRASRTHRAGLPHWLPMPAGVLALGLGAAVWLTVSSQGATAGHIAAGAAGAAATVLGLLMAGLVALVVWLAQQADGRRAAVAEAGRQAEAETKAREGESRLFQFVDAMPVGVFVATPDGRPYYANNAAGRILGRGVMPDVGASELAETYGAFVAGTDRPYPTDDLPVVRAFRGEPSHFEDQEIHKPDGAVIPLEVWGRPVCGAHGEVDYAIAVFADTSERDARERIIAEQAALLDLAHEAIIVQDLDGHIVYWSVGAEHTYGYTRAEAMGRVTRELLGTRVPEPGGGIESTTAREGRWDGELTQRCADGRAVIVESRWAAQRGPDGAIRGFMQVNRNIMARKEAEREMLRRATEIRALNATLEQQVRQRTLHLEQANKDLESFAYSIAHDLRTPLRAMSGFAAALAEDYGDRLGEIGRDYAGRIQAASEHMATLIDDLLYLSRVSRAAMNLQDVDLSAEVTAICGKLRAHDGRPRVSMAIEEGVRVTADRRLICAALTSLLENAWKFTAGRGDDAAIEFATTPVDDAPICCYVRDNGAGFDPAYIGKLFQPFQRLHTVSEFPGIGIGLASVRRIIERHGGRTWAEGAVGHGATFYFTLDAKASP
jgi:PAS domain S-box-containing protein